MNKRITRLFLGLVFSLFLTSGFYFTASPTMNILAFQPTPSDDEVNVIAHQLFCPVCENVPLDVCDTEACRQWRDLIRMMLAEGKTEAEITQYFAQTYGTRVLSEPPAKGFNWLVHILPPIAFALGIFFLFRAFRRWKYYAKEISNSASLDQVARSDRSYEKQFEEELKKYR